MFDKKEAVYGEWNKLRVARLAVIVEQELESLSAFNYLETHVHILNSFNTKVEKYFKENPQENKNNYYVFHKVVTRDGWGRGSCAMRHGTVYSIADIKAQEVEAQAALDLAETA